jgi:hypothetical protein
MELINRRDCQNFTGSSFVALRRMNKLRHMIVLPRR